MSDERIQPIRPEEVTGAKREQIPDQVIETFNMLIAQNSVDGVSRVLQKDVLEQLKSKGLDRSEIFDKRWLDVEGLYRDAGWQVEYDKPGFNEDYDPSFTFRASSKRS